MPVSGLEASQALAKMIKDAHDPASMGTLASAASSIGVSAGALSRVRSGDLKAAGILTLQKILAHYGLKPPPALVAAAHQGAVHQAPGLKSKGQRMFCSLASCETCTLVKRYEETGGWSWLARPRVLNVAGSLLGPAQGVVCGECGSALRHSCGHCSHPFSGGAFCRSCGTAYLSLDHLDEDFLLLRFARQAPGLEYLDRVDEYN